MSVQPETANHPHDSSIAAAEVQDSSILEDSATQGSKSPPIRRAYSDETTNTGRILETAATSVANSIAADPEIDNDSRDCNKTDTEVGVEVTGLKTKAAVQGKGNAVDCDAAKTKAAVQGKGNAADPSDPGSPFLSELVQKATEGEDSGGESSRDISTSLTKKATKLQPKVKKVKPILTMQPSNTTKTLTKIQCKEGIIEVPLWVEFSDRGGSDYATEKLTKQKVFTSDTKPLKVKLDKKTGKPVEPVQKVYYDSLSLAHMNAAAYDPKNTMKQSYCRNLQQTDAYGNPANAAKSKYRPYGEPALIRDTDGELYYLCYGGTFALWGNVGRKAPSGIFRNWIHEDFTDRDWIQGVTPDSDAEDEDGDDDEDEVEVTTTAKGRKRKFSASVKLEKDDKAVKVKVEPMTDDLREHQGQGPRTKKARTTMELGLVNEDVVQDTAMATTETEPETSLFALETAAPDDSLANVLKAFDHNPDGLLGDETANGFFFGDS
ncbi:hypothetical protein B0A48_08300 [Cryoendolithus antarcticus]|uniref:Uncharacterized protein n=1 Tax=Cryoendolithus antarcticus TaxID=1507870 RepID=A0A1V8T526_9PEZI|nr:hypothetical protein B0A48_08300 [Cryoendolithus antarcticus]